jgi:carbamoyl-phosphate synthase large subunit
LEADEKEFGLILVKMIGVDVNAINITEDREQFKQLLKKNKCSIGTC